MGQHLQYMDSVLSYSEIPIDAGVAIVFLNCLTPRGVGTFYFQAGIRMSTINCRC